MKNDPTRREFFRTFGRQTVRNAGTVLGAAAELRRASGDAARELLDIGSATAPTGPQTQNEPALDETPASFASAYRLGADGLLILDQRDLPGRLNVIACGAPTEVASAIRTGVVNAGPVLAEICAFELSFVLERAVGLEQQSQDDRFRAGANTLRGARRDVHALRLAVDRLEARYDEVTAEADASESGPGDAVARAIRAEAETIATAAQVAHAALGRAGADAISAAALTDRSRTPGEPINLLVHGDAGPLSCGMVGTGTALLQSLVRLGHKVHVWVTEAAPGLEGARISALQLAQLDVPHTVIADTAVGWLMGSRRLDGVVLRGDTVCVNGDTLALIGSLNVARLATDARLPVHVLAPDAAFDREAPDARGLLMDVRSPAEQLAASVGSDGHPRPAVFGVRLEPATDVVPAELVTSFLTENGPQPGGRA